MAAGAGAKEAAKAAYVAGRYAEAVQEYGKLIDAASMSDPELHIYYSNRSAAYMQLSNPQSALEDAEMCKRIKPTWPRGYSRCGSAFLALHRYRDAVFALEKALELEPNSADVRALLNSARAKAGMGSSSSGSDSYAPAGSFAFSDIMNQIIGYAKLAFAKGSSMLAVASPEQRMMYGVGACVVVYFLYSKLFGGGGYSSYYSDYDDLSHHYAPQYGLSWTQWGVIMGAAWKVPPMFPDVLGDYARPFFGMSWTNFMYLLSMLTRGQNWGGMFGGGGGGGGRRGRGRY